MKQGVLISGHTSFPLYTAHIHITFPVLSRVIIKFTINTRLHWH